MDNLENLVPKSLQRQITESSTDNLSDTCSAILEFFIQKPLFQQIVSDLINPELALCRKNEEAALELKNKGNESYSRGDYNKAVSVYSKLAATEAVRLYLCYLRRQSPSETVVFFSLFLAQKALRVAPVDANDKGKNLLAVLYINRASALHKRDLLAESLRDCNRALLLSPTYAKAWYRRGKVNASLANYENATRDLDVAMHLEPSSSGKRQIEDDWNLVSVSQKIKSSSMNKPTERSLGSSQLSFSDEPQQRKLQCVSTPSKGRGMASVDDIPQPSLVHSEEPYAVIILKPCRETHCHFCLNELPLDTVPCPSCSIPVYCSQQCQELAGAKIAGSNTISCGILETLSDELKMYIKDITSPKHTVSDAQHFLEHQHECGGVHWPAVLPTEIVLAGRILMKTVEKQRLCSPGSSLTGVMDLCHNYEQLLPGRKLELHISSIILLYCLPQSSRMNFPKNGETVSKFVILLSQIKVNSMAIVRMNFRDSCGQMDLSGKYSQAGEALTSSVEQVKVGQAVYSVGSLFNHSCQPNIHAYFLSRTLFVRSTEYVGAGCPLELSYGPQVGEWDCKKRQEILENRYSFRCGCRGCSEINLPDLVFNALRCTKQNCFGVVLDCCKTQCEKQKIIPSSCFIQQADTVEYDEICKVATQMLQQSSGSYLIEPGRCLNCGCSCDIEVAHSAASKADIVVKCLQHEMVDNAVQIESLSEALVSLKHLKSTLHAYNKRIAEVEDNLAHAFCLVGKLQLAVKHCKASLLILEKLYGHDHIAVGNELLKLSSIQLALSDQRALDSVNQVAVIFSRYYGSHANLIFPCLQGLKGEAHELAQQKGKLP